MKSKDRTYSPSDSDYSSTDEFFDSSLEKTIKDYSLDPNYLPGQRSTKVTSRKRKFNENKSIKLAANKHIKTEASPEDPIIPCPSMSSKQTPLSSNGTTASKKLGTQMSLSEQTKISVRLKMENESVRVEEVYIPDCNLIINSGTLQSVLKAMAVCRVCLIGNLQLLDKGRKSGCSSSLILRCIRCFTKKVFWSVSGYFGAGKIHVGDVTIPRRNDLVYASVLGGRLIGLGCNCLKLYHSSLSIPSPLANFSNVQNSILLVAEEIAKNCMNRAKIELGQYLGIDSSEPYIHAVASYDGAYQQRSGKNGGGHSRYCFASAISVDTAKVLAYGVSCNSCSTCTRFSNKLREGSISPEEYDAWNKSHIRICPATFSHLASVHLESALAPKIVQDALDRGIIFSGLICDGDNKTHETLTKADLYSGLDDSPKIFRYECLSHVAKRIKINLSKAQERISKESKEKKGSDLSQVKIENSHTKSQIRSTLTKKSKSSTKTKVSSKEIRTLSVGICAQIASYYRTAVQKNKGNVDSIIKAIYAIPHHLGANDENATGFHRFCPAVSNSWCHYQAAVASGQPIPPHPKHLSKSCVDLVLRVFSDFGYDSPAFISKIIDGKTSNHNEAIHSVLFRMVHKTEAVGIDVMQLGAALAVIRYNEGFQGIQKLYEALGLEITRYMSNTFISMDKRRVLASGRIVSEQNKRYCKKQRILKKVSKQVKKYGEDYSSGKYTLAEQSLLQNNSPSESDDEVDIEISSVMEESTLMEPDNEISSVMEESTSMEPDNEISSVMEKSTLVEPDNEISSVMEESTLVEPDNEISSVMEESTLMEPDNEISSVMEESTLVEPDNEISSVMEESTLMEPTSEFCHLCGGTEDDRRVGVGVSLQHPKKEINWVCCSGCEKWFHLICLGLKPSKLNSDDWFCRSC